MTADAALEGGEDPRAGERRIPQFARLEQDEGRPQADRQEGGELDQRFHRDGEDKAVLMLGGVGVAGAEQHREDAENGGDEQRQIAEQRRHFQRRAVMGDEAGDAGGNRLQLQGDVRHRADDGDDGGERRDRRVLAVARADEVGDGGDALRLGVPDQPLDEARCEDEDEDRAEIDRQEGQPVARRHADRAEKCPGGAVDGEAERIDARPADARPAGRRPAVSPPGHGEQQQQIDDRREDDDPAMQFSSSRRPDGSGAAPLRVR